MRFPRSGIAANDESAGAAKELAERDREFASFVLASQYV
jgi:hypothetical protein